MWCNVCIYVAYRYSIEDKKDVSRYKRKLKKKRFSRTLLCINLMVLFFNVVIMVTKKERISFT